MTNLELRAPIVLFAFNRPWHTQQTVDALLKNAEAKDSDLIVFSDGPKDEVSAQEVVEVRQYLRSIKGFKSICIMERESNLGLAENIISGVTEVVNEFGRVIVLEDDLVTSPYFLKYMNDALSFYEDDERVISTHGYNYPIPELSRPFFLKGADCLGWGTWKRGWDLFERDGAKLLQELKSRNLLSRFDFFGAYPYTAMLKGQIKGKNQSWAVRWYASALLQDKLTLYPGKTLVRHIGADSGTHCKSGGMDALESDVSENPVDLSTVQVEEDAKAVAAIAGFFRGIRIPLHKRLMRKIVRGIGWAG